MKSLSSYVVFLLIIGLAACSDSQSPKDRDAEFTSSQTSRPGPATSTPEPLFKTFNKQDSVENRQFEDAPDLDLFHLTRELVPDALNITGTAESDNKSPIRHTETFWLIDFNEAKTYQREFVLKLVTPHANWYVEDGLDIGTFNLSRSAAHFEELIYPVISNVFGTEWIPGIDNDHRLNILNARLNGVAGYFNDADEYPTEVRPLSNQSEIIYINALSIPPGSIAYDIVLSHELQHIIHWNADQSEDIWVNEGLSELSSSIALGSTISIDQFLRGPPISLTNWPTSSLESINYYGAASLFMHFLTEHYGGQDNLRDLLSQPEDGIYGISGYLEQLGYGSKFEDVFKEWSAANILDQYINIQSGMLGYSDLEIKAAVTGNINGFEEKQSIMPQYAVEYTELLSISEPLNLTFEGQTTTKLLPVHVEPPGCWWSNSGDSINSTLSRQVNIPEGSNAVLEYEIWFEIEKYWDYLYVEVSVDGGENWRIVDTLKTVSANPFGIGFGPGYTGESGGWVKDQVHLTRSAGEDLSIRFQYITDGAVNAAGACFKNLVIHEAGITSDQDWDSQGFVLTDNLVRQDFQVQLLTTGDVPQVRQMPLNSSNSGIWTIHPPTDGQKLIVSVGSLAEKTRESASYSLSLTPVN